VLGITAHRTIASIRAAVPTNHDKMFLGVAEELRAVGTGNCIPIILAKALLTAIE
jgi:hypothetical protein